MVPGQSIEVYFWSCLYLIQTKQEGQRLHLSLWKTRWNRQFDSAHWQGLWQSCWWVRSLPLSASSSPQCQCRPSIILDGEMLVWDPVTERNLPFGTLKTAALGHLRFYSLLRVEIWYFFWDFISDKDKSRVKLNPRPCCRPFFLLIGFSSFFEYTLLYCFSQGFRSALSQWPIIDPQVTDVS